MICIFVITYIHLINEERISFKVTFSVTYCEWKLTGLRNIRAPARANYLRMWCKRKRCSFQVDTRISTATRRVSQFRVSLTNPSSLSICRWKAKRTDTASFSSVTPFVTSCKSVTGALCGNENRASSCCI